jgi:sec-independent protein translocase protein TatA
MGEFSLSHILILALILLIFFGPSRLPALGQSLGKAIRGFKEGLNEMNAEAKDVTEQKEIKPTTETVKTEEKTEHKS